MYRRVLHEDTRGTPRNHARLDRDVKLGYLRESAKSVVPFDSQVSLYPCGGRLFIKAVPVFSGKGSCIGQCGGRR